MDERAVHEACANLRFAEGLRRRSAEARAEGAVREAASIALLEGARIPPGELRRATHAFEPLLEPPAADWAVALGAWKATWTIVDSLAPLNERRGPGSARPTETWRTVLAGIQRDYGAFLAAANMADGSNLTLPKDPDRWAMILTILEDKGREALETAGLAWALLEVEQPFDVGSQVMGVLAAKWVLASRGVEPSGISVLSALAVEKRAEYDAALNTFRRGNPALWQDFFLRSVVRGSELGQNIARQVQAGTIT